MIPEGHGKALTLRPWSEAEFAAGREVWGRLLASSRADPLFMSWDWQWRWWRHHSTMIGGQLAFIAAYRGEELVGLAPFYSHRVVVMGPVRCVRLEVNGLAWRDPRVVFSEYLDLLVLTECEDAFVDELSRHCADMVEWDEIVFPYTREDSLLDRLAAQLSRTGWHRRTDPLLAHRVPLPDDWSSYLAGLPSSTRRRAFNQRRKLSEPVVRTASSREVPAYFAGLWHHRGTRWGGVESPHAQRFHLDFAEAMASQGQLHLSKLESGSAPLSYLYTVRIGPTEYYLQSGYAEEASEGLSPGYLHLGYAIEACHREHGRTFDFLAGPGRHRDYKADFNTETIALACHQIVRTPWLRFLHRLWTRASLWLPSARNTGSVTKKTVNRST